NSHIIEHSEGQVGVVRKRIERVPEANEDVGGGGVGAGNRGDFQPRDVPVNRAAGFIDDHIAPDKADRSHGQAAGLLRVGGLLRNGSGVPRRKRACVIGVVVPAHIGGGPGRVYAGSGCVEGGRVESTKVVQGRARGIGRLSFTVRGEPEAVGSRAGTGPLHAVAGGADAG